MRCSSVLHRLHDEPATKTHLWLRVAGRDGPPLKDSVSLTHRVLPLKNVTLEYTIYT